MKSKFGFLCLALIALATAAYAEAVRLLSEAELMKTSDLVVIGRAIQVRDLDETNSLGWARTESFWPRFRGVETTFKVSGVVKGKPVSDQIVLHHYRDGDGWGSPPDGPMFIGFKPDSTNEYRLFLVSDGTNRYAPASGQRHPGLSIIRAGPTVANAEPIFRQLVPVQVPARLKIARSADAISVEVDTNSLESTNLEVGSYMVTGVQSETYVYPEGETRPANRRLSLSGGLRFDSGPGEWNVKSDNLPLSGKKYIVEVDLTAFETDIRPEHMWNPRGSKNYKVLWRRTLKQTVE